MKPAGPELILIILAVSDLKRSARFYEQAFSWTRTVDAPVYLEYTLANGMRLGLYQRESFAVNTGVLPEVAGPGSITGSELYLRVADVEQAAIRLIDAGARVLSKPAPRDWGDEVAYVADPDGNVIALARPHVPEVVEPYVPIDCNYYDRLEAAATMQRECEIIYRNDAGTEAALHERITDLFSRDGVEYMQLAGGTVIRLDRLSSVDGVPLPGNCY
jgi:Rho-binding antiterminator